VSNHSVMSEIAKPICANYWHEVPIISTCTFTNWPITGSLSKFVSGFHMPCRFTVKFFRIDSLWTTSFHRIIYKYEACRLRDIQVRHKSILFSNTKLKSTVSHLSLYSTSVKEEKTIVRNVLHNIIAYYMKR